MRSQQIFELTRVRLSARYRGTLVGILWVAISPLSLFLVQALVFGSLFGDKIPHYPLFLLTGLLPWFFLTQSIDMGAALLTHHAVLLKSFQLHPVVIVAALILDNFINFLGTMIAIALGYVLWNGRWHWTFLLVFLPTLILTLWVFSVTWIVAILNVFLRDTRFVISFALQVLFFLTPIFYSDVLAIPLLQGIHRANPLAMLLAPFRSCLFSRDVSAFAAEMLAASALTAATALAAYLLWRKVKNDLYFRL